MVLVERLPTPRLPVPLTLPGLTLARPRLMRIEAGLRRLPTTGLIFFALLLLMVLAWGAWDL